MGSQPRKDDGSLSPRESSVLEAVVRTYVETAEPAGSRTLARRYDFGVSPATIRNTMADLQEEGYLTHPHTSAGRVPTDMAYRVFVDRMGAAGAVVRVREDRNRERAVVGRIHAGAGSPQPRCGRSASWSMNSGSDPCPSSTRRAWRRST